MWANDIHSQLNATHLRASIRPASAQGLQQVVRDAKDRRFSLCIAGGRHVYWSDRSQQSVYLDDYHRELDPEPSDGKPATEMIAEICVPRAALPTFLAEVRADFRANAVNLIYGTVRLVEREERFQSDGYRQYRDLFASGA